MLVILAVIYQENKCLLTSKNVLVDSIFFLLVRVIYRETAVVRSVGVWVVCIVRTLRKTRLKAIQVVDKGISSEGMCA